MCFESLPDELFLLIFRYLHKFELIYAFINLDRRFQYLIEPYLYEIDLTHGKSLSFPMFQLLCQDILSLFENNVRSLRLNGWQQLELFRPYVHQLKNLDSLTLVREEEYDRGYWTQIKPFLEEALPLSHLSELKIFSAPVEALEMIASFGSPKLASVTLAFCSAYSFYEGRPEIYYVKRLFINLQSVASIVKLFKITPNLEELNLSVENFDDLETSLNNLVEVPFALEELHIEFGQYGDDNHMLQQPSFGTIKAFLNMFRSQLTLLTLIAINAVEDFSNYNKLQELVSAFVRIKTFEYYIRTDYKPKSATLFANVEELPDSSYALFTFPGPQQLETTVPLTMEDAKCCSLYHDTTLQELFNCETLYICSEGLPPVFKQHDYLNMKLVNLKKIILGDLIEEMSPDVCQYASQLIALSPNLTHLTVTANDIKKLIQRLPNIIPLVKHGRQINHLEVGQYWWTDFDPPFLINNYCHHDSTFFAKLSKIFPNLKSFKFNDILQNISGSFTPLSTILQSLRSHFRKLMYLKVDRSIYETSDYFEQNVTELDQEQGYSLYYTKETSSSEFECLNIWF